MPPWYQPASSLKFCGLNTKRLRQDEPQKEVCDIAEADVRAHQVLNLALDLFLEGGIDLGIFRGVLAPPKMALKCCLSVYSK